MKNFFSAKYWEGRDPELFIGKLLRYGVTIACCIAIIGGIIYLFQHHGQMPDYRPVDKSHFQGVAHYLRSLSTIFPRLLQLDGAAIIQIGVCILIATPILRVAFSIVVFLIEKDFMYVVITFIVLFIILYNLLSKLQL